MCVGVAKYFKGTGWVLAKNRDQDYIPKTTFIDMPDPKVGEIFVLDDHKRPGHRRGHVNLDSPIRGRH